VVERDEIAVTDLVPDLPQYRGIHRKLWRCHVLCCLPLHQLPQGNLDHGCLQYGDRYLDDADPAHPQVANQGRWVYESMMRVAGFFSGCIN